MQTLLNYSLQSASLIPQYNYGLNPNYLDTLNLYQKYTSMRYPDINSCLNENSFASSPFNVMNTPSLNRLQSNSSIMPSMPSISNTKLQARDFGLFDSQKARSSSMNHSQLHHTLASESSLLDNASANSNSTNVLSSLGPYKQLLENPLSSLLNYSPQGYPMPGQVENLHSTLKGNFNAFPSSHYSERVPDATDSMNLKDKSTKLKSSVDQNVAQNVSSVDLTSATPAKPAASATLLKNALPLKTLQMQPTRSVDQTKPTLGAESAATKKNSKLQRHVNMIQMEDEKTSKNPMSRNVNFASVSKDYLKNNSEMQIIPTTSPPGTSSITKQLNEMSPSISLTAVNTLTEKSKPRRQAMQKNASSILGTDSRQNTNVFKSKNSLHPNISSLSKVSITSPRTGSSNKLPSSEFLSANKNSAESIPNSSTSLTSSQILNKNTLPTTQNILSTHPSKLSSNDEGFLANDGPTRTDVNLQG